MSVGLADFSSFSTAMGRPGSSCHDYDNNGIMGLGDFSVFGFCWNLICTP